MKQEIDMISVIVITYNQEKFITKCLDSILQQKVNAKVEILIGDDASTDNTPNILLSYHQKFPNQIKLILRKQNIGASANTLELLKQANGEYIAFCEGDDFWTSDDKLAIQYAYLKTHKCVGVVHNVLLVDGDGIKLKIQNLNWENKQNVYSLKTYDPYKLPGHISTLFFRKSIDLNNLSLEMLLCSRNSFDKMLFLIALVQGNILRLHKSLSAYRVMRSKNSTSVVAKLNNTFQSNVIHELTIFMTMEKWLKYQFNIKRFFISAKSRVLVTALFHKINGYPISLCEILKLCNHKTRVILYLPLAFMKQSIDKVSVILKYSIR